MRRPIQDPRTGTFTYAEAPAPRLSPGGAVIRVTGCLLHAAAKLSAAEIREPAASTALVPASAPKPGLVRRVWSSFRQSGIKKAYETFVTRKVTLRSIEYGGVGVITAVAPRSGFRVGQRVAWAGYGQDLPAPLVFVATTRLVALPEALPDDLALLALPGGMAWRAVETAELRLGLAVGVGGQNLTGTLARGLCGLGGAALRDLDAPALPSEDSSPERLSVIIVTDGPAAERIAPWISSLAAPQARLVACLPELPASVLAACRAREMQARFAWAGGRGEHDPLDAAASPIAAMEAFARFAASLPPTSRPAIERHDFDAIAAAAEEAFRDDAPPGRAVVVVYPASVETSPVRRFDVGTTRPKLAGTVGLAVITDADDGLRDFIPAKHVRLTGVVAATPETARRLTQSLDGEYGTNDVSPLLSDGKTDAALMGQVDDGFRLASDVLRGRLPLFLTALPTEDESELDELFRLAAAHDAPLVIGFPRLSTPAFADLKRLRASAAPAWMRYDFQDARPIQSADVTFRLAEAVLLAMTFTESAPERLYAQEVGGDRFTTLALTLALSDGSSAQISATFGAEGNRERIAAWAAAGYVERDDLAPTPAGRRAGFESFLKTLAQGDAPAIPPSRLQQAIRAALRVRDSLAYGTAIGLSATG